MATHNIETKKTIGGAIDMSEATAFDKVTPQQAADNPLLHNKEAESLFINQVSEKLSADIFQKAAELKGPSGQIADSVQLTDAFAKAAGIHSVSINFDVDKNEKPEPIKLGSKPVKVSAELNQGAFQDLQLTPILELALHGNNPSAPNEVNLAVGEKQVHGKLSLEWK